MPLHSAWKRRGAAVAAALWISLTPSIGTADIQIESSPDTAGVADLVRNQISGLPRQVAQQNARLAIGVTAFRTALDNDDGRPIIAAYLTSTEFSEALGGRARPRHVTAVFSNPDPIDELTLARELVSHARIAVFDSAAVHSLIPRLVERGVTAIPASPNDGVDALLQRTGPFDVILVLPDPSIFNGMNIGHVVRTLYQQHKVIVGYSDTLTRVGSLASVYPSPDGMARSTRGILEQYAAGRSLPDPLFVPNVDVSLNERLARSLNIVLPDKQHLIQAIRANRETLP